MSNKMSICHMSIWHKMSLKFTHKFIQIYNAFCGAARSQPPFLNRSACRRLGSCDRRPHGFHGWSRCRGSLYCFARLLAKSNQNQHNFHGLGKGGFPPIIPMSFLVFEVENIIYIYIHIAYLWCFNAST